ncbi:unnamed protein product [Effrenium voratum]|uniref:PI3K/PI4K catalytic domain-containing protein n=1 Tax=Effrenium voratum TaxID=2562239 RepID=A0AA36MUS2_9DINO|nr:unnamed protein product [Effrenium voratum]
MSASSPSYSMGVPSSPTSPLVQNPGLADELRPWLALLGLEDRLREVTIWCHEQGAAWLEELVLEAEALAEYLELSELQAENLRSRGQAAMCAVKMSRGTSCTVPTEPAMEGIDSLVSLRTMSTGGAKGALEPKTTCEPDAAISKRSITSICPALTIEAACNFDLGRSQTAFPHCQKDQLFGDGIARTATVQVEGMLCGVFSNLQVKDSALFVREVQRKDAHTSNAKATEEEEKNDPGTQTWPQGSPKRLFHTDTLGNVNGFSKRDKLVEEILEGGVHTSPLDHGQTGTVYALEAGDHKIAIFKPVDGEKFERRSLDKGKGVVREESVYLVDRLCGSQAGVPVSSRAKIEVDGHTLEGSVQAFMMDVQGFIEDYAMPRDLDRAKEFVQQEDAESLALLDMRVFNMDRHPGNLLLLKEEKPHVLGPIDHGCCLPPWWCLSEAIFEAWISWPQLKAAPSAFAKTLALTSMEKLPQTCQMVEDAGLEASAVVTLRMCTILVYIGVAELGCSIAKVANLMMRDEDKEPQELSWLEERVLPAANACGVVCKLQEAAGNPELRVEDASTLEVERFLETLESVFRKDLPLFV